MCTVLLPPAVNPIAVDKYIISQAFSKVWHEGLLYKIKPLFPGSTYKVLKSYLENRYFLIKYGEECTSLHPILSGVPQGSVLGPVLYLLYTADLPTTADSTTATFAEDTAVITTHEDHVIATHKLQIYLNKIQLWLKKWRMKENETKSAQVTFTLKKNTCPPVQLNNKQLTQTEEVNPYPTAFPYGNGMVLHFYQQQESSTTKTVHKVINKGLKTYV